MSDLKLHFDDNCGQSDNHICRLTTKKVLKSSDLHYIQKNIAICGSVLYYFIIILIIPKENKYTLIIPSIYYDKTNYLKKLHLSERLKFQVFPSIRFFDIFVDIWSLSHM